MINPNNDDDHDDNNDDDEDHNDDDDNDDDDDDEDRDDDDDDDDDNNDDDDGDEDDQDGDDDDDDIDGDDYNNSSWSFCSQSQYIFVHDALLQYIETSMTLAVPMGRLKDHVQALRTETTRTEKSRMADEYQVMRASGTWQQ